MVQNNENRTLFRNLGYGNGAIGLPGVDGAIDCTHIRLTQCRLENIEEIYRNRKGYFSLNVQVRNILSNREYIEFIFVILRFSYISIHYINICIFIIFILFRLSSDHEWNFWTSYQNDQEVNMIVVSSKIPEFICDI